MMKEKANVQSAAPRKVKGTVLFTVVCVMMVLIVFLMGTLALASTANRSAQRSYQREQTKANAKAALDSTLEAINQERGFREQLAGLNGSDVMQVNVTGSDGLVIPVEISIAQTKRVYSARRSEWVTGTIYELRAESRMNSTGEGTTYCAYIADDSIAGGGSGNGGGGGGAFVSIGGLDGKIGTSGFTAGGTQVGVGLDGTQEYWLDNQSVQMVPFYVNGSLHSASQCSVYYNLVAPKQYYAVTGDLYMENNFDFVVSPDYSWPDGAVSYKNVPTVYVGGTLYQRSSDLTFNYKEADDRLPLNAYVRSVLPLNVYVGSIESNSSNVMSFRGDIYCFDENKTSKMVNQNTCTALYKWADKTITGPDGHDSTTHWGNFYSAGNAELGMGFQGDVRVAKDVTISKSMVVDGDVVVGGKLSIASGVKLKCKKVYAQTIDCAGEIEATEIHAFSANATKYIYYEDGHPNDINFKHEVPVEIDTVNSQKIGTATVKTYYTDGSGNKFRDGNYSHDNHTIRLHGSGSDLVTHVITNGVETTSVQRGVQELINESFPDSGTNDNEADYNAFIADLRVNNPNHMWLLLQEHYSEATALTETVDVYSGDVSKMYGKDVYPGYYTQENILKDIIQPPAETEYDYPTDLTEIGKTVTVDDSTNLIDSGYGTQANPITASGILTSDTDISHDLYIEASSPIVLIVDKLTVASGHSIYIKDDADVYFYIRGTFTMSGGDIMTYNYRDVFDAKADIEVSQVLTGDGQAKNNQKYYPKVYFYAPAPTLNTTTGLKETVATFSSANNRIVTANVRAPGLKYTQDNGMGLPMAITYYQYEDVDSDNDGTVDSTIETKKVFAKGSNMGVIGQLICGKINVTNQWSMMYVTLPEDDDEDDDEEGEGGGGGGRGVADSYFSMYYNYY